MNDNNNSAAAHLSEVIALGEQDRYCSRCPVSFGNFKLLNRAWSCAQMILLGPFRAYRALAVQGIDLLECAPILSKTSELFRACR